MEIREGPGGGKQLFENARGEWGDKSEKSSSVHWKIVETNTIPRTTGNLNTKVTIDSFFLKLYILYLFWK